MRLLIEATSTLSAEPELSTVMTQLTVLARELVGATHATVNRIGAGPLTPGPHQLAVPIRVRGDLFGTLCLTGSPQGTFDADDVWLTNTLATIAGVAIDNAFLLADVDRRQRWQSALTDAARALHAGEADDRLATIAKFATIAARAEAGYVATIDGDSISLVSADGIALPAPIAPLNCDTAASVLRSNRPALRPDHRTMWAPLGDSSHLGSSHALGVARAAADERFERADLEQLTTFAQLVASTAVDRETER